MIKDVKELAEVTETVEDCGGVYFVPAFSGLYAPYWEQEARGWAKAQLWECEKKFQPFIFSIKWSVIYGLTEDTQRGHILRATLEAVCFQVRDILEAMIKDCNFHLVQLQVDGGMTASPLLLQLQADLVGLDVSRPTMAESSALVKLFANFFLFSI